MGRYSYQLSKNVNVNVLVDQVVGNDSLYNPTLNSILVGLDYSGLDLVYDAVFGQAGTDFSMLKVTSSFTSYKNPPIGSLTLGYHYDF